MTTKSNAVVTHEVRPDGQVVFRVLGAGSFPFDPSGCSDETERTATLHGYVQKISDKAAIPRDAKTGRSATPQAKFTAMKALADHLQGGGSCTTRQPSVSRLDRAALFAAVATVRGLDAVQVEARWRDKPDEALRAVLTHREVAAEYARLTASGGEDEGLFEGLEEAEDAEEAAIAAASEASFPS